MSAVEKKTVARENVYQAGSQGTQRRLNRESGEVEEVPSDPATTPAPGIVDENPPLENEVTGRTKVEPGERPTIESVRGSERPLVDANYRPVSDPETHDGPVFEYQPTTDAISTTDDDEDLVTPEDNAPDEKKTFAQQREDNAGATPGNLVAGSASEEESVYAVSGTEVPDRGEDTYEADKARATEKVPTSASNKQEIKDYLIYQHGVDPDDLEDQSKAELLELVDDLAE